MKCVFKYNLHIIFEKIVIHVESLSDVPGRWINTDKSAVTIGEIKSIIPSLPNSVKKKTARIKAESNEPIKDASSTIGNNFSFFNCL